MLPQTDKSVNYEFPIAHDQRIRVHLIITEHKTDRFAVSLELLCGDEQWRRVVCIDNWGGRTHRDRYLPNGRDLAHHEHCFDSEDIDAAMKWAQEDLMKNASAYVSNFRALL